MTGNYHLDEIISFLTLKCGELANLNQLEMDKAQLADFCIALNDIRSKFQELENKVLLKACSAKNYSIEQDNNGVCFILLD